MQAEKLRIFRAMQPLDPKEVVRGQFSRLSGRNGVAKDSQVELSPRCVCVSIPWRWADVPFFIRAARTFRHGTECG